VSGSIGGYYSIGRQYIFIAELGCVLIPDLPLFLFSEMSQKTVFVIGAGASKEVNLPVGSELKKQIVDALNFQGGGVNEIRRVIDWVCLPSNSDTTIDMKDLTLKDLYEACSLMRGAMPLAISIDNFIDAHANNKGIKFCGKLCIAHTILKTEESSSLFVDPQKSEKINFYAVENTHVQHFFPNT
jgi:hypothetical protein